MIEVRNRAGDERGVFATKAIKRNTVIDEVPVLLILVSDMDTIRNFSLWPAQKDISADEEITIFWIMTR